MSESRKSTPVAMVAPELKLPEQDSEITRTCAVLGCEDSKFIDPENFFGFPEDPERKQLWVELTGRQNWTPTDYSYICIQHFSFDSFMCNNDDIMLLMDDAVPSLKLPGHVLEVEYIEDDTLESEAYEDEEALDSDHSFDEDDHDMPTVNEKLERNSETKKEKEPEPREEPINYEEVLKLFSDLQKKQRLTISLKHKLKWYKKAKQQQNKQLQRVREEIRIKQRLLDEKMKRRSKILLSLQDKIREDKTGLVLATPVKYSDDLKNFALSIYKYSPQSYIYLRNSLRTMLPSTDVLETWITSGFQPLNVMNNSNSIKVIADQTAQELACKIIIN